MLHFNDSLQVSLAARFIWRWHSNITTTLRFQWKTCDLFFVQITWFCTPVWFRCEVWICRMISMKILFHVSNLLLLKGQKYHQGSILFLYSKTSVQDSFVQCLIVFFVCDLWPDLWPVTCGLWRVTCGLWPVACNLTCNLTCGLWPVTCDLTRDLWPAL